MEKTKRKLVGHCAVDSGQILLVDPFYLKNWVDNHYSKACEITLHNVAGEILVSALAGAGVVSSTGYGDGNYPVYAEINKEGRVLSLKIDFVGDDEEEEEE